MPRSQASVLALLQAAASNARPAQQQQQQHPNEGAAADGRAHDDADEGTFILQATPEELTELRAMQQLRALVDASHVLRDQQVVPQLPLLQRHSGASNTLYARVRREAQQRKLQVQAEHCLNDEELRLFGALLQEHAVAGSSSSSAAAAAPDACSAGDSSAAAAAEDLRINYDGFSSAGRRALSHPDICGAAVSPFTAPDLFLRFQRDSAGAISLPLLLHYISCHTSALRLRLQLSVFDTAGAGHLDVQQLQAFLQAAVPGSPMLQGMEGGFLPHYLQIATRKLLLFHGRRSLGAAAGATGQQRRQRGGQGGGGGGEAGGGGGGSELVVRLADLVNSPVMAELQELLLLGPGADQERDLYSNWFSLQSTQRVLATFTSWDLDGSGSLSKAEFSAISQGAMSELFISRVFEEHVAQRRSAAWPPPSQQQQGAQEANGGSSTPGSPSKCGGGAGGAGCSSLPVISRGSRQQGAAGGSSDAPHGQADGSGGGSSSSSSSSSSSRGVWPPPLPPGAAVARRDEMDLLAFADFVLAWDHRNQPAAIPYFFRIFDIQHRGCLTVADLYTFFREIHAMWVAMGEYAELEVHDVLDEVMDIVQPATPGRITQADLAACKMSGTVFSILANVDQFYQYNFRENFMHQEGEGGEAATPA